MPRAGSDGQLHDEQVSEQCSLISTSSTEHLWLQGERRFSLLHASHRKRKTKAVLAPTASIPRTTPDQSLVSMAAGELGSAVHGHSYRPTQHKAWLALHKSMEIEATDKLHYCQSWYNAQASTSA